MGPAASLLQSWSKRPSGLRASLMPFTLPGMLVPPALFSSARVHDRLPRAVRSD